MAGGAHRARRVKLVTVDSSGSSADGGVDLFDAVTDLPLQLLDPRVLAYGFDLQFVKANEVVEIALRRYRDGLVESELEESLAFLLSDELDRVPVILGGVDRSAGAREYASRVWFLAVMRVIRIRWAEFDEPWMTVEWRIDEFEYPEAASGFLYYAPQPDRKLGGERAMSKSLDDFLERESAALVDLGGQALGM